MAVDFTRHPCFNDEVRHTFGRIHLPVAPKCNVQCNFCNRDFDCMNESRPGVTSAVLSPGQALYYLEKAVEADPRLSVMGIAGPGDPFANADETMETLRLVRKRFPEMILCVATNGLNLAPYVDELAELEVSHVTITINAIDPEIAGKVYAWIRDGKRVYRGREAGELMVARQLDAVRRLAEKEVLVKVNSIIIPGMNDDHVVAVAEKVKELGATILNSIPIYPVEGTPFGSIDPPTADEVAAIRAEAGEHLPLMHHCTRCRADAVGILGQAANQDLVQIMKDACSQPLRPQDDRPYVAVASYEGMLVNQHLGEARQLWIYGQTDEGFELVETRETPPSGGGAARWEALGSLLQDCRSLLTASAGQTPVAALEKAGVQTVMMEGLIEEGLDAVYRGQPVRSPLRRQHRCGSGCSGTATGCG